MIADIFQPLRFKRHLLSIKSRSSWTCTPYFFCLSNYFTLERVNTLEERQEEETVNVYWGKSLSLVLYQSKACIFHVEPKPAAEWLKPCGISGIRLRYKCTFNNWSTSGCREQHHGLAFEFLFATGYYSVHIFENTWNYSHLTRYSKCTIPVVRIFIYTCIHRLQIGLQRLFFQCLKDRWHWVGLVGHNLFPAADCGMEALFQIAARCKETWA